MKFSFCRSKLCRAAAHSSSCMLDDDEKSETFLSSFFQIKFSCRSVFLIKFIHRHHISHSRQIVSGSANRDPACHICLMVFTGRCDLPQHVSTDSVGRWTFPKKLFFNKSLSATENFSMHANSTRKLCHSRLDSLLGWKSIDGWCVAARRRKAFS